MFRPGRKALFGLVSLLVITLLFSACAPAGADSPNSPPPAATLPAALPTQPAPANRSNDPAVTSAPVTEPAPAGEVEIPGDAQPPAPTESGLPVTNSSVPTDSVTAFPDPNALTWAPVVSGLNRPLDLIDLADGSGRLLVLEQPGVIRVIQQDSLLPEPFLDIVDRVGSNGNERGLLGIALHPNFLENRYFYLNYTDKNGNTVIARFSALADDFGRADPGSEKVLLQVQQPYANHNGGGMAFGPDGALYSGLGDGGSSGDPQNNGQSPDTLLGSILRIDVDGGDPYAIPADNPFVSGGGAPEVWAYGLRNPWRFSFDRLTGDLYIADVGQNAWEEINFLPAGAPGGANFGWNYREGAHDYRGPVPSGVEVVEPVYDYSHADGCSVTGGYVYRGQALPELRGIYIFADYCSGKVWGMLGAAAGDWQVREMFQTGMNISAFGLDSAGELYLIDQASGGVYRLQHP